MTIRISLVTVLAALVFVAIGAGAAVGVMLWEPWGDGDGDDAVAEASPTAAPRSAPTPYQRRLTGPEAAAIAKRELQDGFNEDLNQYIQQTPAQDLVFIETAEKCEAKDFNEQTLAWIVECDITSQLFSSEAEYEPKTKTETYRVYDRTGNLEPIMP